MARSSAMTALPSWATASSLSPFPVVPRLVPGQAQDVREGRSVQALHEGGGRVALGVDAHRGIGDRPVCRIGDDNVRRRPGARAHLRALLVDARALVVPV